MNERRNPSKPGRMIDWRNSISVLVILAAATVGAKAEPIDLASATIKDINDAFDSGALTSQQLVQQYLKRIVAYDKAGPVLNAVITINPHALDRARALDAERADKGARSPLHGIPVVLKDNIDTGDMPTTAGSFMLRDSVPPDDAFVTRKLRDAGAIVLAKVNMGEFALGGPISSSGGRTRNPHDLSRSPAGSSSGTGVAIAAAFAQAGLGTDTGGSVRIPSSFNGIVGLKTTYGLVSRDGVVPLALSLDTVGPMARSVYDVAAVLGAMAGTDPSDDSTHDVSKRAERDYTKFLDADGLKGARIGIVENFASRNAEVGWVFEASLESMKRGGAEVVEVSFPDWFVRAHTHWAVDLIWWEFGKQIHNYLETLGDEYPKSLDELIARAMDMTAPDAEGMVPNPGRWVQLKSQLKSESEPAYKYHVIRNYAMPMARYLLESTLAEHDLDALVFPTMSSPANRVDLDVPPFVDDDRDFSGSGLYDVRYGLTLANLAGAPELVVPAGFTGAGLPVSVSFLGRPWSEPKLLSIGYAFEQRIRAYRLPNTTPLLSGESAD